jgi:F-type H+-transporting ATPase subunit gamma
MTRRHSLEQHRTSLVEIREIMNSMKTLAYLETRKLSRFLQAQHAVVQGIEDATADLLSFYPELVPDPKRGTTVLLLIGSERGFCGEFNHSLLKHAQSDEEAAAGEPLLIAVGHKLHTLLENDARVTAALDGAGTVEEIGAVLGQLAGTLNGLQDRHGLLSLVCLHHADDDNVVAQTLLPPFQDLPRDGQRYPHPPMLNLPPQQLLLELADQYLLAALHQILYTSLMAENHHRVNHLEGAVSHLDEKSADLGRQCNMLRQEEIIEEIEVILLSSSGLTSLPGGYDTDDPQDPAGS